jgi:chorismate synthase
LAVKEEIPMTGSSFGRIFRITTFGESHGKGIGVIIDGMPPKVSISEADIQVELDRRRPGQSRITTSRSEPDTVEILSGVFEGLSTGTPLGLFISNRGSRSGDYVPIKDVYRPGHADYTYQQKYGIRDWRGSGRASGRETAARVAAGAVAKKVLLEESIKIVAFTREIGGIAAKTVSFSEIERNIVRSPDGDAAIRMIDSIESVKSQGDSVGGIVEVLVQNIPPGLGDPVFDKLEALLAHAIMSIGAVRGVEVGSGFGAAKMRGSEYNDSLYLEEGRIRTETNNAGGILGGITTGEDIVLRAAVRPTGSISKPQQTVSIDNRETSIEVQGRHDPCIVPRIIPVIESMTAITILDCLLQQTAYTRWTERCCPGS